MSSSQEGVSDPFSHRKRENPVHPKIPLATIPLAHRIIFPSTTRCFRDIASRPFLSHDIKMSLLAHWVEGRNTPSQEYDPLPKGPCRTKTLRRNAVVVYYHCGNSRSLWRFAVNFPQENKVFQSCRSVLLPS